MDADRHADAEYRHLGRGRPRDHSAAKRAAVLTHRLLACSRWQTLDSRPTNVNQLVAGIKELIRRTIGPSVTLKVVAAGELWPTLVNPSKLENALSNLCINAHDAMLEGGWITVETTDKPAGHRIDVTRSRLVQQAELSPEARRILQRLVTRLRRKKSSLRHHASFNGSQLLDQKLFNASDLLPKLCACLVDVALLAQF